MTKLPCCFDIEQSGKVRGLSAPCSVCVDAPRHTRADLEAVLKAAMREAYRVCAETPHLTPLLGHVTAKNIGIAIRALDIDEILEKK